MKKQGKNLVFVLILSLPVLLTACAGAVSPDSLSNGQTVPQKNGAEEPTEMGRYVKEDITPEGFSGTANDLYLAEDKTLWLNGKNNDGKVVLYSKAIDGAWQQQNTEPVNDFMQTLKYNDMPSVTINTKGNAFWIVDGDPNGHVDLHRVNIDGTARQMPLELLKESVPGWMRLPSFHAVCCCLYLTDASARNL